MLTRGDNVLLVMILAYFFLVFHLFDRFSYCTVHQVLERPSQR